MPHHISIFVVHCFDHSAALLGGHLGQQVGEVVEFHFFEHVNDPIHVERSNQGKLFVLGQLFQQVGQTIVVHFFGEQLTLLNRQRTHDCGHIAWVHVAQTRCFSGHFGGDGKQTIDIVPIDEAIGGATSEHSALGQTHFGNFPPCFTIGDGGTQPDIAHQFAHQFLVDDVGAKQALAVARLERVQVHVPTAQTHTFGVDVGDAIGIDKDAPTLAGGNKSGDTGGRAATAGHHDNVVDTADCRPAGIKQRQAHHPECINEIACHGFKGNPAGRASGGAFCLSQLR